MKKILLGLGTIGVLAIPLVSVVACTDDRDHKKGHLKVQLDTWSLRSTVNDYMTLDIPKDNWNERLEKLRELAKDKDQSLYWLLSHGSAKVPYLSTTYSFNDWVSKMWVDFDYTLDFNDSNRNSVYYEMKLSNVKLNNKKEIIKEIEDWKNSEYNPRNISFPAPRERDKDYIELYELNKKMYDELAALNKEKILEKRHTYLLQFVKKTLNHWSINSEAVKELEKNVTHSTPVKSTNSGVIDLHYKEDSK